jgi:hypothetical protein
MGSNKQANKDSAELVLDRGTISTERGAELFCDAIISGRLRSMLISYLSYALKDTRTLDLKAYQLLQLTIESLGGDEDITQKH